MCGFWFNNNRFFCFDFDFDFDFGKCEADLTHSWTLVFLFFGFFFTKTINLSQPKTIRKSTKNGLFFFYYYFYATYTYIVRRIIMKVTQFSDLKLQFGSVHAQTWTVTPNQPKLTTLVACCVKSCVWRVVRCILGLQFNNDRKLPENIFKNLSTVSSQGAARGKSAGTNGSILMLECAWSTRLADLVEYGTVLA